MSELSRSNPSHNKPSHNNPSSLVVTGMGLTLSQEREKVKKGRRAFGVLRGPQEGLGRPIRKLARGQLLEVSHQISSRV